MIAVGSYPELFDTLIGWQQYQNLWTLLTQTGLVFLPFIALIAKEWLYTVAHGKTSLFMLRKTTLDVLIAFFVIEMCMQPAMPLNANVLEFTPTCNYNNQAPAFAGNSGTTYDTSTPIPQGVNIPLFWYLIVAVSHGFALGAENGMTCMPDLREIQTTVSTAQITDPAVKQQIQQFYQDCYRPAFASYLAKTEQQNPDNPQTLNNNIDVQWIGSTTFLNGAYATLSASTAVPGFPYNPATDYEYGQYHGQWGRPTCQQWWQGTNGTNGLEQAITNTLQPTMWQQIKGLATGTAATSAAMKEIIQNSIGAGYQNLGDQAMKDQGALYTGVLPDVGTVFENFTAIPKYYELISALPVVQSHILMGLYFLIALIVTFSGFRFSVVCAFSFAIFSVTFWSYFFQLASYIHYTEAVALFPPGQLIANMQSDALELIDLSMYIGLPFLLSSAASWAGFRGGSIIDNALNSGAAVAADAGAAGAGGAGKVASKVGAVAAMLL